MSTRRKSSDSNLKVRIVIFIVLSMLICSSFLFKNKIEIYLNNLTKVEIAEEIQNCEMLFHFIDVGQGDATLIEFPDDKVMLIDCTYNAMEYKLEKYLTDFYSARDNKVLDYLIITHQDADHVGGADMVLDMLDVKEIYRPNVYSENYIIEHNLKDVGSVKDNSDYAKFMEKVVEEKLVDSSCQDYINTEYENIIDHTTEYSVQFMSPLHNTFDNPNDYSPVIKIECFGKTAILTGDATDKVEEEVVAKYGNELDADIYKAGHHGSSTSSSKEFMEKMTPEYVVISCGLNNRYGHPNKDTMETLSDFVNAQKIYRTDLNGNIVIGLDKDAVGNSDTSVINVVVGVKTQATPVEIKLWYIVLFAEIVLFSILFKKKKIKFN